MRGIAFFESGCWFCWLVARGFCAACLLIFELLVWCLLFMDFYGFSCFMVLRVLRCIDFDWMSGLFITWFIYVTWIVVTALKFLFVVGLV